jgi:lysophospholipid acyltransferase (LPLAT)-like uncharacterized protein
LLERAWLTAHASLTSAYLQRVARTLKLHLVSFGPDDVPTHSTFGEVISAARGPEGILLPFWNAHSLLLIGSYISSEQLSAFAREFEAVADDSTGGRLTHVVYRRLGIIGRRLSVESPEDRLADLRSILESRPNLAIAADSHGPYREVSSGTARLARYYSRSVVPLSAVCTRTVRIFSGIGMAVPLPGATVRVGFTPLQLPSQRSVPAVQKTLHQALVSLERRLATAS